MRSTTLIVPGLHGSGPGHWLRLTRATWWAERWGSRFLCLGSVGHLNVESGHGPWPEGKHLLETLQRNHDGVAVGELPVDGRTD